MSNKSSTSNQVIPLSNEIHYAAWHPTRLAIACFSYISFGLLANQRVSERAETCRTETLTGNRIKVTQTRDPEVSYGFGNNEYADGTYVKRSSLSLKI
jgi:hypothetical protein